MTGPSPPERTEAGLDAIEAALTAAGSTSPVPRIVDIGTGDALTDRDIRLFNAADAAIEKSRQRALLRHAQRTVTQLVSLDAIKELPADTLLALDPLLLEVVRELVNTVCDDVVKDVHNKLRLIAAVHPATHSHPSKENP